MGTSLFKLLFTFSFILASTSALAQSAVSASGGHAGNATLQVSWTVGELVIDTYAPNGANNIVTSGLHQTGLPVVVVTSIEEEFRASISLYPNPSNKFVNVTFDDSRLFGSRFILTDNQGSQLTSGNVTPEGLRLDVSEFAQGFYFLRLSTPEGKTMTLKFLKK